MNFEGKKMNIAALVLLLTTSCGREKGFEQCGLGRNLQMSAFTLASMARDEMEYQSVHRGRSSERTPDPQMEGEKQAWAIYIREKFQTNACPHAVFIQAKHILGKQVPTSLRDEEIGLIGSVEENSLSRKRTTGL